MRRSTRGGEVGLGRLLMDCAGRATAATALSHGTQAAWFEDLPRVKSGVAAVALPPQSKMRWIWREGAG